MERHNKKRVANGLLVCGVLLILAGLGIFLYMQTAQKKAGQQIGVYVEQLQQSIPEVRDAFEEERTDMDMPVMEVSGEDFVGILEVPAYGAEFPIGNEWENDIIIKYPCRYWGSLYDGSLIIGGGTDEGQLEFAEDISIGDIIQITDMTGARYSYEVSWVEKVKELSKEYLENLEVEW